jgi:1-aminocyclopropane-1-carboxylate deaminase/D-cysteine desulfhydrase-like pyridoxal-dependent ACC family enzyme
MALTLPERYPLATLPTPLVRSTRLERALHGPPILVKRDDLTGFALAGNKARKLEFLLGDALAGGCDVLVTGGGPASNHCQATAAAARVAGLSCHLVMYGSEPAHPHPNLALARRLGATVSFTADAGRSSVDPALAEAADGLAAAGRRPYLIPRGGASAVGAAGYGLAVGELAAQLSSLGIEPEIVVVATGSCGTQAGLLAGVTAQALPWRVIGATVSRPPAECRERVLRLTRECAELLGWPPAEPARVEIRDARGPGYSTASAPGAQAARLAASADGLLLDPVFTAKAFAELVSMIEAGLQGPAVFVHTGGTAAAVLELITGRDAGKGAGDAGT